MSDIQCFTHSMSRNFTVISNEVINHQKLSLQAKALLIWAIAKPPEWKMNTLSICSIHNISKNKVSAITKELKDNNCLVIHKGKNGYTKWLFFGTDYDYQIYKKECPSSTEKDRIAPSKPLKTVKNTSTDTTTNPYPHFGDMGKNDDPRYEDHHSEDLHSGDALVRTDLLVRTDQDKDLVENEFDRLWQAWPNSKNKKKTLPIFAKIAKHTPRPDIFVNNLIADIQARIQSNQLGFTEMMLSTYLNGERWQDGITNTQTRKDPLLEAMGLT